MGKQHISGVFSAPIRWIGKTTSPNPSFMKQARVHSPAKHRVHSSPFPHELWSPIYVYTQFLLPLGYISPAYSVGLFFIIGPQRLIDFLIHSFIHSFIGSCVCVCVCVCVCMHISSITPLWLEEVTERAWCVLTPPSWSMSSRHVSDATELDKQESCPDPVISVFTEWTSPFPKWQHSPSVMGGVCLSVAKAEILSSPVLSYPEEWSWELTQGRLVEHPGEAQYQRFSDTKFQFMVGTGAQRLADLCLGWQ